MTSRHLYIAGFLSSSRGGETCTQSLEREVMWQTLIVSIALHFYIAVTARMSSGPQTPRPSRAVD